MAPFASVLANAVHVRSGAIPLREADHGPFLSAKHGEDRARQRPARWRTRALLIA